MKRVLPESLRNAINDYVNMRIKLYLESDANNRNDEFHKRITKLEHEMYQVYPDLIVLSENAKAMVQRLSKTYEFDSKLDTDIAKNDLMYQYTLLQVGEVLPSLENYFTIGLNGANIITKIAEHKFSSLEDVKLLDFASGYGRITRFMIQRMDPKNVWVSDIKESAVDWQKSKFGVNGFPSSYVPEEIGIEEKFDVIFVGSLFSHLPDRVFARWMKKLYEMLTDRGVLAITVHDNSERKQVNGEDIEFFEISEDNSLRSVEDRIQHVQEYGITYVSQEYVIKKLKELGVEPEKVSRFPLAFGGSQDLYCINQGENPFNSEIKIEGCP